MPAISQELSWSTHLACASHNMAPEFVEGESQEGAFSEKQSRNSVSLKACLTSVCSIGQSSHRAAQIQGVWGESLSYDLLNKCRHDFSQILFPRVYNFA